MDSNSMKPFFYTITDDITQELKEYLSKYFSTNSMVWLDKHVCKFLKTDTNVSIPEMIHFINNIIAISNKEYDLSSLSCQKINDIRNNIFDIFTNCDFNYVINGYYKYVDDLKLNKIKHYVEPEKGYLSATDLLHMDTKYLPQDALSAAYDSKLFTAILEFCNLTGLYDYRFDIAVDSNLQKQMEEKLKSKIS